MGDRRWADGRGSGRAGRRSSVGRMLGLAVRGSSARRGRVVGLAAGIAVASASFSLLSTAVTTSQAQTVGTVTDNVRSAYDVLVRPAASTTPVEQVLGTVRENYLSGIFGGVTLADLQAIRDLPGVEVAAPVANLGYANVLGTLPVNFSDFDLGAEPGLYRLKVTYRAANGAASYPDADQYFFYSGTPLTADGIGNTERTLQVDGRTVWPCWYYNLDPRGIGFAPNLTRRQAGEAFPTGTSAFDPEIRSTLSCRPATPGPDDKATEAGVVDLPVAFPVLLSAIDPAQEDALVDLSGAVTQGRYLKPAETAEIVVDDPLRFARVPFLLSDSAFTDVDVDVQLQQLQNGDSDVIAARLSSPDARPYVDALPGRPLGSHSFGLEAAFADVIEQGGSVEFQRSGTGGSDEVDGSWINGPVTYTLGADATLTANALPDADPQLWATPNQIEKGYDGNVPVDNLATQVRPVQNILGAQCLPETGTYNEACFSSTNFLSPLVVGRFDPAAIQGFSGLSRVPLETYTAPVATGADPRSRQLLNGQQLRPDRNLGGYLTQPPAMITSIGSLDAYFASRVDSAAQAAAPISSIRVRVAGVTGIDALSEERVLAAAASIRELVGADVQVEVTVGTSPAPQQVSLPAGSYGPQALAITEQWAKKGVAVRITDAVDRKSLVLFCLVLIVCALFVAQGSLASVRSRRTEIATLSAMGWTRTQTAAVVLAEVGLVGVLGGAAGVAVAAGAGAALGISPAPLTVLLAFPVAVAVALLAGLAPALWVSRLDPVAGLSPPVVVVARARRADTRWALALLSARRTRVRTLVGASGLAVAVAALTFLVGTTLAYRAQVTGNLLGSAVLDQARTVDLISIGVLFVLAAFCLTDVLLLSRHDSARDQAMLAATGWTTRDISSLILREAAIVGGLGALTGAALGLGLSLAFGRADLDAASLTSLLIATGLALLASLATLLLAAIAPVLAARRSSPSSALTSG